MSRSVPEWIGKTMTQRCLIPSRSACSSAMAASAYLSGIKIGIRHGWELGISGSATAGNTVSNFAPALVAPHKDKTRADRRLKAKNDRVRKKHFGLKKPRKITRWRRFDGSIKGGGRER